MADYEQVTILQKGAREWNAWRSKHFSVRPDLSLADLWRDDLRGANLRFADLSGANLSEALLQGADLGSSNLMGALLNRTDLSKADLSYAQLIGTVLGANLRGANLFTTNLADVKVNGADFTESALQFTTFGDVDLRTSKGLEHVHHRGPSTIGLDTIFRSKGQIPESFLRGCGVPDSFITQMHSLVGAEDGIQFYSCFISYSFKDEEFARRLHGRMRDAHLRVWFAPEDIRGGQKLHEQIETAIHVYDKLLIVLSEASLQSEWVMTELRKARKAERQSGKRKLFPVRLVDFETLRDWECFDADGGKDLAIELREYFIPDFSNWKDHDAFEPAFARLLKDLKSAGSPSR